jgi:hypothetical protein
MPAETAYEHGARKLKPRTGPDPSDDFSQKAAENKKPLDGMGLTETDGSKKSKRTGVHPPRDTKDSPTPNPNGNG